MVVQESTAQKDEEIIISIVKEMTESMTGAQSTRRWAEDWSGAGSGLEFATPALTAPQKERRETIYLDRFNGK